MVSPPQDSSLPRAAQRAEPRSGCVASLGPPRGTGASATWACRTSLSSPALPWVRGKPAPPCADMEASEGAWFLDRLVTQEGRLTTLVQPQPCLVTGAGDPYLRGDDEHRPPRRPGHLTDPPSLPATAGLSRALSPPVPVTCRPSAPPETDPPAGGHKALPSPSSSCRLLCLSPPSPGPQGPQFPAKRAAAPRAAGQS